MNMEFIVEKLKELMEEYNNLLLEAQAEISNVDPNDIRNVMEMYVRKIDALKIEISKYKDLEISIKLISDYGDECDDPYDSNFRNYYNSKMKDFLCKSFGWNVDSVEMKLATNFRKDGDYIFYDVRPGDITGYTKEVSLIDGSTRHCGFGEGRFWTDWG